MNYEAANALLSGRNKGSRKLENNTYLIRVDKNTIAVQLHHTNVVTFHKDGRIILRTGGWQTVTTKDRLNNYSPVRVFQRDYEWFVAFPKADGGYDWKNAIEFESGMDVRHNPVAVNRLRQTMKDMAEQESL
jgi:hypothetical protein